MKHRELALTETFVTLADTLVQDFDLADLLQTLTAACVDVLGAAAAGIVLATPGGTLQVMASSDQRMRLVELFEVQNDEGPCSDCHASGQRVRVDDLRTASQWPRFTQRALEEGYRSVYAVPLRLRELRVGALNMFGDEPDTMSEQDCRVAQALADVATIALLQERALRESEILAVQLQQALNSRVIIEQAKGVIAEQTGGSVEESFELLRAAARRRAITVSELSERILQGVLTAGDLG